MFLKQILSDKGIILEFIVPHPNVKSAALKICHSEAFSDLKGLTLLAEGVYSVALRSPGP